MYVGTTLQGNLFPRELTENSHTIHKLEVDYNRQKCDKHLADFFRKHCLRPPFSRLCVITIAKGGNEKRIKVSELARNVVCWVDMRHMLVFTHYAFADRISCTAGVKRALITFSLLKHTAPMLLLHMKGAFHTHVYLIKQLHVIWKTNKCEWNDWATPPHCTHTWRLLVSLSDE